ncbi:MAG: 3-oxoacyl-[acyl-carrier-protein] reductase [Lachnospiraceae bacterium]|nr:3-oxoacyl-[acyl-carrier-protein] reductase [Lachnospiraceae bacterium]
MLKGQVAIVTGASRGIGAAIAKKLASMGADIAVIFAGNEEAANAVCRLLVSEYGVRAKAYKCDVADFEACKETVAQIKADFGTVNILINNAGITRDGLIAMMKEDAFDSVIAANLKGTFNMIRQCTGIFVRNRAGRIVNISSVSGMIGNAGQANYSASKAGIIGLTKSVARELASRNITCNAVAPGFVETDMTKDIGPAGEELKKSIPLGRLGKPEDIADAVAFLVTADYITGEVLKVDGGIAM